MPVLQVRTQHRQQRQRREGIAEDGPVQIFPAGRGAAGEVFLSLLHGQRDRFVTA